MLGDGIKCLDDCSGSHIGWLCTGGDHSSPSECVTVCGDSIVVHDELCDDGNTESLDGCDESCVPETGWTHENVTNPDGTALWTVATNVCGDGLVVRGETCDNEDKIIGDGIKCLDDCSGNYIGWLCEGGSTTSPTICDTVCGDSVVLQDEYCDDGNLEDWDGCNHECFTEVGWTYENVTNPDGTALWTVATNNCGDGIVV